MQSGKENGTRQVGLRPDAKVYYLNRLLSLLPGVRLNRYFFISQPVASLPQRCPAQFCSELHTQDAPALASLWPEADVRTARFEQGARCLTISCNNRLAGGIWFADDQYAEDEVRATYRLDSSMSWDFGLFIHPDFRATRAFAALWAAAAADLAQRGKSVTLSRISDYLAPSLLAHERMNAKSIGHAIFLTIGIKQYCHASGAFQTQNRSNEAQFHFGQSRS